MEFCSSVCDDQRRGQTDKPRMNKQMVGHKDHYIPLTSYEELREETKFPGCLNDKSQKKR